MSAFFRKRIEDTIEHMILLLDEMDGDPDFEDEPLEEQHDREDDPAEGGTAVRASPAFVIAEAVRRQKALRR